MTVLFFAEKKRTEKDDRERRKKGKRKDGKGGIRKYKEGRKDGKKGGRKYTEEKREGWKDKAVICAREGAQPSSTLLPVLGLAASRPCRGVGTGLWQSPGRRVECLRDVFIP